MPFNYDSEGQAVVGVDVSVDAGPRGFRLDTSGLSVVELDELAEAASEAADANDTEDSDE